MVRIMLTSHVECFVLLHSTFRSVGRDSSVAIVTRFSGGEAAGAWRCPSTPIYRRSERKNKAIPLGHRGLF